MTKEGSDQRAQAEFVGETSVLDQVFASISIRVELGPIYSSKK